MNLFRTVPANPGTVIVRQGDSGGPLVLKLYSSASERWLDHPLGLATAGALNVQERYCPGVPSNSTEIKCTNLRAWYSNLPYAANTIGVDLVYVN